jgi:hypothetical protein
MQIAEGCDVIEQRKKSLIGSCLTDCELVSRIEEQIRFAVNSAKAKPDGP